MTTTEEGWHTTADGTKLYTKTWSPDTTPKARLVFVHGFSDHCNAYGILFPSLAKHGIEVLSFDQRGWGRSVHQPSQKGLTGPTSQVLDDLTSFIKSLPINELPLFLMGHSMGATEVLVYAATGPTNLLSTIRGFLAEAPHIAVHSDSRPMKLTVIFARLAGRILPHRQMLPKIDPSTMSRDPDVCKAWEEDTLCHDTGTLEGLVGLVDRANALEENKVVVKDGVGEGGKTRLWIGHGTADRGCDYQGTRKWFENLEVRDKEMRAYEGWYHKLHAEPGDEKVTFANDVAKWVLDRCDNGDMQSEAGIDPDPKPKL